MSALNTFMRKGKDPDLKVYPDLEPDPEPDSFLCLMDPDPRGPKTCGNCESGSGSPTLDYRIALETLLSEWN